MFFHYVKKGDNLYQLSKTYNVPLNQLIEDNNLEEPYTLLIGECLIINAKTQTYIVKENDTLDSISKKFSISKEELIDDNNLKNGSIKVGNKLIIDHDNHNKEEFLINGFCYQGISNQVLNQTLPSLTFVAPFAYRLKNDGSIIPLSDQRIINKSKEYDVFPMLSIANIKESGGFSTELSSSILNSEANQNRMINELNQEINKKGYKGLCIDFEYVKEEEKNLYSNFLRKVKSQINSVPLFVALAPKYSDEQKGRLYTAHDYYAIGNIADYVILMTYEWGYTYGEPMAVAPLNQVRRVIRYAKSKIDKNKIIMGLPNYGYDWTLPYQKGTKADSISNTEAINIAKKYKVEIKRDSTSQTPYFNYEKEGKLHVVHFDDACAINAKINLAIDEEIKGLSIWTITTYYPQMYLLLDYYFSAKDED